MSLLNKVKNFFYEEVEEDEEEIMRKEEEKRRLKEQKKEEKRRAELEKLAKEQAKREEKMMEARTKEAEKIQDRARNEENVKEELSERELFKSEKTFNFPMDLGDDIFDEEVQPKKEEKPAYVAPSVTSSKYENISRPAPTVKSEPKDEGPHRFKPSPVISPVYGILDKNYTVEDVKERNLDKTKEFSLEKRTVDFDSVRNRAYKELDEEIEKTLTGNKDIFYNLDNEEKEENIIEQEEESIVNDFEEPAYDAEENDVVITYDAESEYEDETPAEEPVEETEEEPSVEEENTEEEEEEDFTPDVAITRVEKAEKKTRRSKRSAKEEVEEESKDEEKEDLFNLIDNMYTDDDEEEDE